MVNKNWREAVSLTNLINPFVLKVKESYEAPLKLKVKPIGNGAEKPSSGLLTLIALPFDPKSTYEPTEVVKPPGR